MTRCRLDVQHRHPQQHTLFHMDSFKGIYLTLACVLVLGSASDARSEVYRWTDSQGVVHFSDQPVSTDPQKVKEVTVPKPNVVDGFKARPSAPAGDAVPPGAPGQSPAPAEPATPSGAADPKPKSGQGNAARSKESCQEKVAAYIASRACFRTCAQRLVGGGTNPAGCEHCVDQPMPPCWSRY